MANSAQYVIHSQNQPKDENNAQCKTFWKLDNVIDSVRLTLLRAKTSSTTSYTCVVAMRRLAIRRALERLPFTSPVSD
jgi:hypothetical protein